MDSNLTTRTLFSLKSMSFRWFYSFARTLVLFLKIVLFSSSLLWNTQLFTITRLVIGLGKNSQMLFLSNWFNSYCIAKNLYSSMRTSLTSFSSTPETKSIKWYTWYEYLLVILFKMYSIIFYIGWYILVLHSLGRFWRYYCVSSFLSLCSKRLFSQILA